MVRELVWIDGLEWVVCVDGKSLKHETEFKYLGCVLDGSSTCESEYRNDVGIGGRVTDIII